MGVSISEGPNLDLAAILQGGEELQARIAAFKRAKEAADKRVLDANAAETGAAAIIDAAKVEAASIIEDARAEGEKIVTAAVERRKKYDADLARIKADLWERVDAAVCSVTDAVAADREA